MPPLLRWLYPHPALYRMVMGPAAGVAAVRAFLARHRVAAWQGVGRELGLRLESPAGVKLELSGDIDGWRVVVSEWRSADYSVHTLFRAFKPGAIASLFLSRERVFNRGDDIQTGDEEFDREVCVLGDESTAFAVLDRETRSTVRAVLARRDITLQRGDLSCELSGYVKDRLLITSILDDILLLAPCLSIASKEIPLRLAKNAASDDFPLLRRRNLELLYQYFRETDSAREAFLQAASDPRPEMRLTGATYLGDFDLVAKIAGVESGDVELRLRAVRNLIVFGAERAGPLLDRLLSTSLPAVLKAVVAGIGQLDYRAAAPTLIALLGRADAETAAAAADALRRVGDPSAEPALLSLLERGEPVAQIAAARALGQVGTVRAVESLLAYTQGLFESDLKLAAREAVGAIQARLGSAEAGRLSLSGAAEGEGALSVALSGTGRLSLDDQSRDK